MKTTFLILAAVMLCAFSLSDKKTDRKEIEKFLVEMTDARLMDREEGRLAAERGTTKDIRDYGSWMVNDQTVLLEKLKKLAAEEKVTLPEKISAEKSKALEKLKEKTGTDFDDKFLKMIKIDHKRDVRKFKKAAGFDNANVSTFAKENLPTIEKHLSGVEAIKKSM